MVDKVAEEIFNVLKGANYKLRLFTSDGIKTTKASEATRFYAYDQDVMVTIRQEDAKIELLVQAGNNYDIPDNRALLDSIKSIAHKSLGEFTVRKFNKKIEPKDFAHQNVTEAGEEFDFDNQPKLIAEPIKMPKDPNAGKPLGKTRVSRDVKHKKGADGSSSFSDKINTATKTGARYTNMTSKTTKDGDYSFSNTTADDKGNFSFSNKDGFKTGYDAAIGTALKQKKIKAGEAVKEGFSKPFGSIKTSYVKLPEARLIIKHSKGVNEEVRGSRSRHIHSLFIENSQGEKFKFPHRYMSGAKAMAMHVNEGGTPYDSIGQEILSICEEIADLNKFVRHVKTHNLVNETNSDVVETVSKKLLEYKNTINSLSTQKGYNSFQVQENKEKTLEKSVDITDKFLYNTFKTEELNSILTKVGSIVEANTQEIKYQKELLQRVVDIINSKQDLKISYSEDDPEHPDNQGTKFADNEFGKIAKLNQMLDFLANRTKNEDLQNALVSLADGDIHNMSNKLGQFVIKIHDFLIKQADVKTQESTYDVGLDEDVILELRKKIS